MDESIAKNIRDNLILFKNETLKDIKEAEKILLDKFKELEYRIIEKIDNFDKSYLKFSQKFEEIISFIDNLKDIKNNVNILLAYKIKSENSLIDLSIKLKSLDKDFNKSIFKINSVLSDSVIYPGIIGGSSKFKTFHDIIDYILASISHSKSFKDKISKEVNHNKNVSDINIEKLKNQIDAILDKTKHIITSEINSNQEIAESRFKKYDEKLKNLKLENDKNNNNIQIELGNFMNNLKEQIKEISGIKKELFLKFSELKDKYNQNNNEINDLNEKNIKLSNFITEIKYKIDNSFVNELDNSNKTNKKRDSIIKSNRIMSAKNNMTKKSKSKKYEGGINELIKDKINIEHLHAYQNKNKYKIFETGNISNELYSRENNINSIINFFPKSQSCKRFPLNKEEEKILNQNNINNKNLNKIKEINEFNISFSYNDTKRAKKNEIVETVDNSFKIRTFNDLNEKSNLVNLFSNNKYINSKILKNISLKEQNEIIYNEENNIKNYIDNQSEKNLLQNNNNINIYSFKSPQKHKYNSGYPRIITNQGEKVIISSHPVFHRHKFTNNFSPSIFFTSRNINYNKKKESKNSLNKNLNSCNESELLDENNNKDKLINEKSNCSKNNYDFCNYNIFKTMPNPKINDNTDKKDFLNFGGRNNSYKNKKKNKNCKFKKGK